MKKKIIKLSAILLFQTNLLYSNSLLIDVNFGMNQNIVTYSNFPTSYNQAIDNKIDQPSTEDFTSILRNYTNNRNNFNNINVNKNDSDETKRFYRWLSSIPGNLSSNNIIFLSKDISSNKTNINNPGFHWGQTEVTKAHLDSIYDVHNIEYDNILDSPFCETTRYENDDFIIRTIETNNQSINENIETMNPTIVIKYKKISQKNGSLFNKPYLNLRDFVSFFKTTLDENINRDFSNLVSSVDIYNWKYENILGRTTGLNNILNDIETVKNRISELNINISERDFIVSTLNIIKNIYNDTSSLISSNSRLYDRDNTCIRFDSPLKTGFLSDFYGIISGLKSKPSKNLILNYGNKYNTEQILFTFKKEVLEITPDEYNGGTITTPVLNYSSGNNIFMDPDDDSWWYGWGNNNETTDVTFNMKYKYIEIDKIKFSTVGFLHTSKLLFNSNFKTITSSTYVIPNINSTGALPTSGNSNAGLTTAQLIQNEQTRQDEIQGFRSDIINEAIQENQTENGAFHVQSIDAINSHFNKNYDSTIISENREEADIPENSPTDEEWNYIEDLINYGVSVENGIREQTVINSENLINSLTVDINNLELNNTSLLSNINTLPDSTKRTSLMNQYNINNDSINIKNNEIGLEEQTISKNQPFSEEEGDDYFTPSIVNMSQSYDISQPTDYYVDQYFSN